MKRLVRIFVFALMLLMLLPTVLSATVPYSTYTYSIDGDVLDSPDAYVPQQQIDSISLGLSRPIKSPSDIDTDKDGNVYIVDKGTTERDGDVITSTGRIIVTDAYYKLKYEINSFVNSNGVDDYFDHPESLFVVNNDENPAFNGIYVCDSKSARIVVFDLDGEFIREIKKPKSNLIDPNLWRRLCNSVSAWSMRMERLTSCSRFSRSFCPICLRYMRTGSSKISILASIFSFSSSSAVSFRRSRAL